MQKKTFKSVSMIAFVAAALLGGCGKKEESAGGVAKEGAAGKAPVKVEASPEMKGFLAGFNGKSAGVEAALAANGLEGLDAKDMGMYDLASPSVTGQEKRGENDCYTFDAKAGMTTRTYDVCWKGGKIVEVTDKGMR
jgi:hypothetical protein